MNNIQFDKPVHQAISMQKSEPVKIMPVSYIEPDIFKASLGGYCKNYFIIFLISVFGKEITSKLIDLYKIGTSKNGGTVFWQIDKNGNIRTGKIIIYNPVTGHRIKDNDNGNPVNWVHKKSELKLNDFNLEQCLFGEHLLNIYPNHTVCIVESEKTAITASEITSGLMPDCIWLATGGKQNLNAKMCQSLKGRNVILYPDLSENGNTSNEWKAKAAEELKTIVNSIEVSDLLERRATATDRVKGLDIADFLIRIYKQQSAPVQPLQAVDAISNTISQPVSLPLPDAKRVEIVAPSAMPVNEVGTKVFTSENILLEETVKPYISTKTETAIYNEPFNYWDRSKSPLPDSSINEMETYLLNAVLPPTPFYISKTDFVESDLLDCIKLQIACIRATKNDIKLYQPAWHRLITIREQLDLNYIPF